MRVVVTGAAGFIGRRLAGALQTRGRLDGQAITELILVDRGFAPEKPSAPSGMKVRRVTGDLRDAACRAVLFHEPLQGFFHLAATLTAEAERDFESGIEVNLVGLLGLLDDCRRMGGVRLIFTSSMAAFGGTLPEVVPDEIAQRPQTSYGVQKVIAELLLDDYTRRGFLDGRALRLPVVLMRPKGGAPALSELISAVAREPLAGRSVVCPLKAATRFPVASAGAVAKGLIALFEVPSEVLGAVRTINLPGLSVTVDDMVAAVIARAGESARDLITWQPDPRVQGLMDAMPRGFTSARAIQAGLRAEPNFDAVIDDFLAHP